MRWIKGLAAVSVAMIAAVSATSADARWARRAATFQFWYFDETSQACPDGTVFGWTTNPNDPGVGHVGTGTLRAQVVGDVPGSPPFGTEVLGSAGEPLTMRDDPFADPDVGLTESGTGIFRWKINGVPTVLPVGTIVRTRPSYGIFFDSDTTTISDCAPVDVNVAVAGTSTVEGTGGTPKALFAVTLEHPWLHPISVAYATVPTGANPATPNVDYTPATGTLTFAPGEVQKRVAVAVKSDAFNEVDETLRVDLSNVTGQGVIAKASGKGTIIDDDPHPAGIPRLRLGSPLIYPGVLGQRTALIPVTITPASSQPTTVDFTTQVIAGQARERWDFTPATVRLTFNPGQAFAEVRITVQGNDRVEPGQTFRVVATPVGSSVVVARSATVTILPA